MRGHQFAGAKFAIAQFRMGVQIASPGDHFFVKPIGVLGDEVIDGKKCVGSVHEFILKSG
jgi:hypothetical protein